MADGTGDPGGDVAYAALMAGGAEVALPQARDEGEQMFFAAVRAAEAEETGGQVAAAEEIERHGEGFGAERSHGGTVEFFVGDDEVVSGGGDDLPERRGAGAAGMVDGRHKVCSQEHTLEVDGRKLESDGFIGELHRGKWSTCHSLPPLAVGVHGQIGQDSLPDRPGSGPSGQRPRGSRPQNPASGAAPPARCAGGGTGG